MRPNRHLIAYLAFVALAIAVVAFRGEQIRVETRTEIQKVSLCSPATIDICRDILRGIAKNPKAAKELRRLLDVEGGGATTRGQTSHRETGPSPDGPRASATITDIPQPRPNPY